MKRLPQKVTWIFMALAATVVLASPAAAQTVSVNRCAAAKVRCVEGYTHVCGVQGVEGLFKCYQNATLRGRFVDQVCVNRTFDKLTECFRDAEGLNAVCLTRNDVVAIQEKIATFVVDAVSDLIPGFPYPVTNTCAAGKQKTLSEATSQKLACFEEAFRREPGVVAPGCFNKAQADYDYQWAKLEGNGGCLTLGDAPALASKMDNFVADMITSLDP